MNAEHTDRGREITFAVDRRLSASRLPVLELETGRIATVQIKLYEMLRGGDGERIYGASLDPGPVDDAHGFALVITPADRLSVVTLTAIDLDSLAAMRPPRCDHVVGVKHYGLDLDGDGRAEVAFMTICISERNGQCLETNWAARFVNDAWQMTKSCEE
jgi:hypothetical protein